MLEPAGPMFYFVHFVFIGSDSATVNSLVGGHLENWKKCLSVELSAYDNYSDKRTPEKNQVDGRLHGS